MVYIIMLDLSPEIQKYYIMNNWVMGICTRNSFSCPGIFVFYGNPNRGALKGCLEPPPTWFFDIFFNVSRMVLKLCRWLTQPRIHFLRAWVLQVITRARSFRPISFANLGNYRLKIRFFFWTSEFLLLLVIISLSIEALKGRWGWSKPKER